MPSKLSRDFGCASVGCCIANCFTHPLETIKVRQILNKRASPSTMTVGITMVRTEGMGALYKGINAAFLRAIISGGGRLSGYNLLKDTATTNGLMNDKQSATTDILLRGSMAVTAACSTQLLATPFDLVRTKQAAHIGNLVSTPSALRIFSDVVATRGACGLFAGSTALMSRAITFNLSQLLTYDYARQKSSAMLGLSADAVEVTLCASLIAGLASATASAPSENIKTVMQMNPRLDFTRACRYIVNRHGRLGLWRGWTPLYLKQAPHTVVMFVVMEHLRGLMGVKAAT